MIAGRDLDALVAEKVMGMIGYNNLPTIADLEKQLDDPKNVVDILPSGECRVIRPYSTSIAAAWEVVEKLSSDYSIELTQNHQVNHLQYICKFWKLSGGDVFYDVADIAPLAICLAALKAVGAEVPEHV